MGKLTEETIKKIKCLRSEGMKILDIAERLEISGGTVSYYSTPSYKSKHIERVTAKFKSLSLEQKKEKRNKYKEYQRLYHKKKYHEDKSFRDKQKEYSINYKMKALKIKKQPIEYPKRKFNNPFIRKRLN